MPFAPSDLSSLAGWYDADDAATFTFSSGTSVSQWRDKSGLGRHFAQATASLQPTRSGTYNGRTSVVFDGTDDYMDTASFTVAQPITVFMALKPLASDVDQGWFSSVGGNLQFYMGGGNLSYYAGTVRAISTITSNAQQWAVTFNGASSSAYRNGTLMSSLNPGTSGTTTGFRLAERNLTAGYRINGDLFEVVVYSRVLTGPERVQVEEYLTGKWLAQSASGTVAATSGVAGAATLRATASGTTSATSATTGDVTLRATAGGTVDVVSSISAEVTQLLAAAGQVNAVTTLTGAADLIGADPVDPIEVLTPDRLSGRLRIAGVRGTLRTPAVSGRLRVPTVTGTLREEEP